MQVTFVGTWKLNLEKSDLDPKHVPLGGTVVFELDSEGWYLMRAEGIDSAGKKVAERPQRFVLDGEEHPIPDMPGLKGSATRPDANTLVGEAKRNGEVVGHGVYEVSADGKTLTATATGMGVNGPFKTRAVFDRQSHGSGSAPWRSRLGFEPSGATLPELRAGRWWCCAPPGVPR